MAEKVVEKELYDYQERDLNKIFNYLEDAPDNYNLLYQLPTGGGKTVVFSEIVRRYIEQTNKKVVILTHRIELCKQTSKMLGISILCSVVPFGPFYIERKYLPK